MKSGTMPDPEDQGSVSSGSSDPGRVEQCLILKIKAVHLQGKAVHEEWDMPDPEDPSTTSSG